MRLIDADAFKREVIAYAVANNIAPNKALALCKIIDKQPAVDAEPVRHGRWVEVHNGLYVRCTVCKTAFIDDHEAWPCCPVCGAKMDGGTQ